MTDHLNPKAYAEYLASYIADPSTIRVRTLQAYGRAPSIEQCRQYRDAIERRNRPRAKLRDSIRFECRKHPATAENAELQENGQYRCKTCVANAASAKDVASERDRRRAERERREKELKRRTVPPWAHDGKAFAGALKGDVLSDVARVCGVTVAELKSDDRTAHLVRARSIATMVFIMRGHSSYPIIARILNRKCHTSIMHLHDTFPERAKREPWLWEAVRTVLEGAKLYSDGPLG